MSQASLYMKHLYMKVKHIMNSINYMEDFQSKIISAQKKTFTPSNNQSTKLIMTECEGDRNRQRLTPDQHFLRFGPLNANPLKMDFFMVKDN